MTDFFDDLERQLLEAARERPQRLRRARVRRALAVGGTTVALLAGGVGVAAGLGGGHGAPDHAPAHGATTAATATIPRDAVGQFTVAVLNGTTTPGAAGHVARELAQRGAHIGVVANAADQVVDRSRIYFRPGHQQDGALIANLLADRHVSLWQGRPGSSALVLAGAEANVVVLVGRDLVFPGAGSP